MSRTDGTNPRARGESPRQRGVNPRAADPLASADLTADELYEIAQGSYALYRRTKHWRETRAAALKRAGRCCERCNSSRRLEVHHRSYERLGAELPEDLEVLCHNCHTVEHFAVADGTYLRSTDGRIVGLVVEVVVDLAGNPRGEPLRRGKEEPQTTNSEDGGAGEGTEQPPLAPEELESFGVLRGRKMQTPADRWMLSTAIDAIGTHYAKVMEPRSGVLDAEQRKIIRDALDVATVAECKHAIDGCAASEFHMGKNDRRQKYNRLSQILKGKRGGRTTREQIDMFLEIADNGGSQSGVTSADHARVQQAKRDVLDGWEFPNDTQAVERANEAKAWLKQQGWRIEYEENGRPQFTVPGS